MTDIIQERYELAKARIPELRHENFGDFQSYVSHLTDLFIALIEIYDAPENSSCYKKWNVSLYEELFPENYETSYANPAFSEQEFSEKLGRYMCWYYVTCRKAIPSAYQKDLYDLVLRMELFIQMTVLLQEDNLVKNLKENAYYYIHDYTDERMERSVRQMVVSDETSVVYRMILSGEFSDLDYLYRYGRYITDNEIKMAAYLNSLPQEKVAAMAATYTEGLRKGMEIAGIDISAKKTIQIRYPIGFEPMVYEAVKQFEAMGLKPVFSPNGLESTSPNKQADFDHRFDEALYLNHALVTERLKASKHFFEQYKEDALGYAGPAVIEVFGEKNFQPKYKKESLSYTPEQEKMSVEYKQQNALIVNQYIPRDQYSYTIIAYPIPDIGDDFERIFDRTVEVNTLDMGQYQQIQQCLIDALDQGYAVHITGRDQNITDLTVTLHELTDPAKQTNFENCLADVNIPVGEVFTSPVLNGTTGTLFVSQVYLEGLRYENLKIEFKDGMIAAYDCSNFENAAENKAFIKENILMNRETLPMGEFAIGTNTTAYVMGREFGIEGKLPILIAEKTGPHFAVGDTCYSMSEELILHNPDGKEIIAKENECSALRKTEPEKAYFNCHTDITIPYDELGEIEVLCQDGRKITLIHNGRFVLPGTEALNDILDTL